MPQPPKAGDYLVLMGWSVEYIQTNSASARQLAAALKERNPQSRVVIAYVTEQLAQPEPPYPLRKEQV